jgi:hypothetical protein
MALNYFIYEDMLFDVSKSEKRNIVNINDKRNMPKCCQTLVSGKAHEN